MRRTATWSAQSAMPNARAITQWNATPYVQVALVAEQGGNYAAARAWIDEATRRDSSDWRLWVTAARIEAESGRVARARRSLARARVLNPRLSIVP
jgi:Flp pilus assembly protein TadD